jgi:hypothetical protein
MLCLFFLICEGSPTSRDVYWGIFEEEIVAVGERRDWESRYATGVAGCPRVSAAAAAHATKVLLQRPSRRGGSAAAAIGWRRCSRACANRRPVMATKGR